MICKVVLFPDIFEMETDKFVALVKFLKSADVKLDKYIDKGQSCEDRNYYGDIARKQCIWDIMKMINTDNSYEINGYSGDKYESLCKMKINDSLAVKYMLFLIDNNIDFIVFSKKCTDYIDIAQNVIKTIYDPYVDCSNQIYKILSSEPSDVFYNAKFCDKLQAYFKETIFGASTRERMVAITEVGVEVATRNYFFKDANLTKKNSSNVHKRVIFSRNDSKQFYLSLDYESGGFELFDHSAKHRGQYSFDGELVKKPAPNTHKIIL